MGIRVGLLLILLYGCASNIQAQQKDELVNLRGRVTDVFGNPLEKAFIQSFARYGATDVRLIKDVVSDEQGNYSIAVITYPGTYLVTASCAGFKPTEISRIHLSQGKIFLILF